MDHVEAMRLLLEHGADAGALDISGLTPINLHPLPEAKLYSLPWSPTFHRGMYPFTGKPMECRMPPLAVRAVNIMLLCLQRWCNTEGNVWLPAEIRHMVLRHFSLRDLILLARRLSKKGGHLALLEA